MHTAANAISRTNSRAGQSLVTVALGATFLLTLTALGVDAVLVHAVQARLSSAVDAASLAGARTLGSGGTEGEQAKEIQRVARLLVNSNLSDESLFAGSTGPIDTAIRIVSKNEPKGDAVMFEADASLEPGVREVRVNVATTALTFFARIVGVPAVNVSASAAAQRRDNEIALIVDRSTTLDSSLTWDELQQAVVGFMSRFNSSENSVGVAALGSSESAGLPVDKRF